MNPWEHTSSRSHTSNQSSRSRSAATVPVRELTRFKETALAISPYTLIIPTGPSLAPITPTHGRKSYTNIILAIMGAEDLQSLLEMGFEKERAEIAAKQPGNIEAALSWLEKNQDTPLEELQELESDRISTEAIAGGQVAQSLVCKDCGKKFRTTAAAEFHASKSEHTNFEESTEEIKPLTEEEKKAKLEELRMKAAARKAGQSQEEKEAQKRNEQIKRKATKETQDMKEELAKKEQIKDAEKKRKEKQADLDAKARIKAKIEADKADRRAKAEREKAAREGRQVQAEAAQAVAAPVSGAGPSKPAGAYTETRMRFQTPGGNVQKTFPVETTLFEVAQLLESEHGTTVTSFVQNFPRKTFDRVDFGATLKELGLVPSTSLIVR